MTVKKINRDDAVPMSIRLPKGDRDFLDSLVEDGTYMNRTDAVRDLIRKAANEHKPKSEGS